MRRVDTFRNAMLFIALLFVISGLMAFGFPNAISGTGPFSESNTVYFPVNTNILCTQSGTNPEETLEVTKPTSIYCGKENYAYFTQECQVTLKISDTSSLLPTLSNVNVQKCNLKDDSTSVESCDVVRKYEGSGGTERTFDLGTITINQKFFIDGFTRLGVSATLRSNEVQTITRSQAWQIVSTSPTNFLQVYPSCLYRAMVNDDSVAILRETENEAFTQGKIVTGYDGEEHLGFNQVLNIITGYQKFSIANSNIIDGGKYYTDGNGLKYPIKLDTTGVKWVDTRAVIVDKSIICNPALPNCVDDGRRISETPSDKTCDDLNINIPVGWVNIGDNQVATFSCESGKIIKDNERTIPTCPEGEMLNSNYFCSKVIPIQRDELEKDESNVLPVILLIGGIVGAAAIYYTRKGGN